MSKKFPIMLVTLSAIFWGTNFTVGKVIVENLPPFVAAAIRFSFASLLIIPLILFLEPITTIKEAIKRNWGVYIVMGLLGVVGFNGLFFLGLKYTTPINGSLIMGTNPLVTMLLAAIFLKERIHAGQRVGVLFSLIGVIVVITNGSLDELLHFRIASGDWIIMAANVCWAFYGVLGRLYLKESKPLITTAATMVIGSIALLLMASYDVNMAQLLNQTVQVYASLMYIAICGTVLAYLFWNYGINHLGVGTTSVFFNLVPVVTVIMAIMLGQPITFIQILGGMSVITGVLLSTNVVRLPYLNDNALALEPLKR